MIIMMSMNHKYRYIDIYIQDISDPVTQLEIATDRYLDDRT